MGHICRRKHDILYFRAAAQGRRRTVGQGQQPGGAYIVAVGVNTAFVLEQAYAHTDIACADGVPLCCCLQAARLWLTVSSK